MRGRANTLQTLVQGAGSGSLQKLIVDLKSAQGDAQKAAKVMADNLGGVWEGFRIQIEETTDGPLRGLTKNLSNAITDVS